VVQAQALPPPHLLAALVAVPIVVRSLLTIWVAVPIVVRSLLTIAALKNPLLEPAAVQRLRDLAAQTLLLAALLEAGLLLVHPLVGLLVAVLNN
jgi:hypothetical protein